MLGDSITHKKCTNVKWSKGGIPTNNEITVWMHGFHTTMVQPVCKQIKSLGLVIDPYDRCILMGYRIFYGTIVLYDYTRLS